MKSTVLHFLASLFRVLPIEDIRDFIDAGLDKIEDKHIEGDIDTPQESVIAGTIAVIRGIMMIDDKKYGSDKIQ